MWESCQELQDYIVNMRRNLHRIPEIGSELPKTRAYVRAELDRLGIPYKLNTNDDGIIAYIKGSEGKTVALRADMDALPIREETGLSFASEHPGCMHACGHDAHTAMLLGAARVLNENRDKIPGTVKLLFQTAEEISAGARVMIAEGAMDDVNAIFGTHVGTIFGAGIPTGTIICAPGRCMASFDKFIISVHGTGCHGSTPEAGVDPVNIAAHIVISLQEILAREIAAVRPAVLTIGKIIGGATYNVIPSDVVIEGTFRALEPEIRMLLAKRIEEISSKVAETFRGEARTEMVWGGPPLINDGAMAALAAGAAKKVLGEGHVMTSLPAPSMGGEDFAYYLEKKPGAFMVLSTYNPAKKADVPHHNSRFMVDEDVFWMGAAVFVSIIEDYFGIA